MHWSAAANAGFSSAQSWIELAPNYPEINVEAALADGDSVLHHYRRLIALRKAEPLITSGKYRCLLPEHPQVWAYLRVGEGERLLVVNNFYASDCEVRLPEAQDPLGLSAEQWAANPRQAGANAQAYNTRKGIAQRQVGLVHTWLNGGSQWRLMVHGGQRQVTQFQAIPAPLASTVQTLPGHPGGVIELDRTFAGLDARWSWQGEVGQRPLSATAGWAFDQVRERRRGFQNFEDLGPSGTLLGVRGALRRHAQRGIRSSRPGRKPSSKPQPTPLRWAACTIDMLLPASQTTGLDQPCSSTIFTNRPSISRPSAPRSSRLRLRGTAPQICARTKSTKRCTAGGASGRRGSPRGAGG